MYSDAGYGPAVETISSSKLGDMFLETEALDVSHEGTVADHELPYISHGRAPLLL